MAIRISNNTIINDSRNIIDYGEGINALGNTGVAKTINLSNGTFVTATLTENCTFTFQMGAATAGAISFSVFLRNDATAGRSITWHPSGTVKWTNGTQPVRTTTANAADIWSFFTVDGGATWYGSISVYNFV
jgi:hypothetical protein